MEGILEGVTTCHRLSHFVTIVTGCDTCSRLPSLTIVSSVINEASVVVNMYLRFIDNQATKQVNPTAQKKYLISPVRVASTSTRSPRNIATIRLPLATS